MSTHPSIPYLWRERKFTSLSRWHKHNCSLFFCFSRPGLRTKTSNRKSNSPERPEFTSSYSQTGKPWWSSTHPFTQTPRLASANHHGKWTAEWRTSSINKPSRYPRASLCPVRVRRPVQLCQPYFTPASRLPGTCWCCRWVICKIILKTQSVLVDALTIVTVF